MTSSATLSICGQTELLLLLWNSLLLCWGNTWLDEGSVGSVGSSISISHNKCWRRSNDHYEHQATLENGLNLSGSWHTNSSHLEVLFYYPSCHCVYALMSQKWNMHIRLVCFHHVDNISRIKFDFFETRDQPCSTKMSCLFTVTPLQCDHPW